MENNNINESSHLCKLVSAFIIKRTLTFWYGSRRRGGWWNSPALLATDLFATWQHSNADKDFLTSLATFFRSYCSTMDVLRFVHLCIIFRTTTGFCFVLCSVFLFHSLCARSFLFWLLCHVTFFFLCWMTKAFRSLTKKNTSDAPRNKH